jgi:hypothetical protein
MAAGPGLSDLLQSGLIPCRSGNDVILRAGPDPLVRDRAIEWKPIEPGCFSNSGPLRGSYDFGRDSGGTSPTRR